MFLIFFGFWCPKANILYCLDLLNNLGYNTARFPSYKGPPYWHLHPLPTIHLQQESDSQGDLFLPEHPQLDVVGHPEPPEFGGVFNEL